MSKEKLIEVLVKLENTYYSWNEIKKYCEEITIDPQYVWNILIDDSNKCMNKLVDEQHFSGVQKFRLNKRGLEFLQNQKDIVEKNSWKPTIRELIGFVFGVVTTLSAVFLTKIL